MCFRRTVIGVARRKSDDSAFRQKLGEAARELGTQKGG
jgi:hypothetical protein